MTIAFYTNFINHHQLHLSDELFSLTNGNYWLIELMQMPNWLKSSGYPDYSNRPYVIQAWKNESSRKMAEELCCSTDVAIFGADSIRYEIKRAQAGKLSFEVSERWLKRGILNLLSPCLIKNMWYYHTLFYRKPVYKLCASAYAAGDQYKMYSYKGRCYKWGYFTEVEDCNIRELHDSEQSNEIRIMWCSRFLKWKHPELPIRLAARLKKKGCSFRIDMFGTGELLQDMKTLAKNLDVLDVVKFCANKPNREILKEMREHDIFLFTSDRNEGWGAVLNEAMSCGCAVVASNMIGSVPYLINDSENGMVFKSGNLDSLEEKVVYLLDHPFERNVMAENAYHKIKTIWSPASAAKNLLQLINDLTSGRDTSIMEGPCSKALPI